MIFGLLSTSLSAPFSEYSSPDLGSTSVSFTAGGAHRTRDPVEETRCAHRGVGRAPRGRQLETKNQPRKAERFGRSTTHSDLPRPFHSPPHAGPTPLGPSLEAMGEASGSPAGSAWAAAALFARVLASSLAVAGPAVLGVPSAFRLDAPMTHEVLTTTRVAAAAHTLVVLVAHALSSARASSRPLPYARERAGLVVATARAVSALTMGTAVWFVAVACFGVSAAGKPLETAHLAVLLASLTLVPGAVRHGVPLGGAAATTWGVLVTAARGVTTARRRRRRRKTTAVERAPYPRRLREFEHADLVWVLGGWGASLGAWCGAMVIPLDWDRPWQKWPVPCVAGAVAGSGWGLRRGGDVCVFALHPATPTARRRRKTE